MSRTSTFPKHISRFADCDVILFLADGSRVALDSDRMDGLLRRLKRDGIAWTRIIPRDEGEITPTRPGGAA